MSRRAKQLSKLDGSHVRHVLYTVGGCFERSGRFWFQSVFAEDGGGLTSAPGEAVAGGVIFVLEPALLYGTHTLTLRGAPSFET